MSDNLDILIVGGGVHGSALALRLITEKIVDRNKLRVLDPHESPLEAFHSRTRATGMEYLRSPGSHSLAADKTHLLRWGASRPHAFSGPQRRPSTSLFFAHAENLLRATRIQSCFHRGTALEIHSVPTTGHRRRWRVETDNGSLETRILILAPGAREIPLIPDWAKGNPDIFHVFSPDFPVSEISNRESLAVIGGGMSAHQLALRFSGPNHSRQVTMIRRHPTPVHAYDSDPGYLGVKKGAGFAAITNYEQRRTVIRSSRWPGSVPGDLAESVEQARRRGNLELIQASVVSASAPIPCCEGNNRRKHPVRLSLDNGENRDYDGVILATGFLNDLPQRQWISSLVSRESLKTFRDGYPLVSPSLEWAPGLFVSGGLAELETGPSCLNIIGAHKAYEKMQRKISEGL